MIATLLLGTRATAMMYYGEELGMTTTPPTRVEDVKDPIGKIGWPKEKGRDGERTPMQWDGSPNAGFTAASATPWLPVPPSYKTVNVAIESREDDSLLNWYQQLIQLRRDNPALHDGTLTMLNVNDNNVLSWLRKTARWASCSDRLQFHRAAANRSVRSVIAGSDRHSSSRPSCRHPAWRSLNRWPPSSCHPTAFISARCSKENCRSSAQLRFGHDKGRQRFIKE